jgi:60s Acidic ribosomal protein
MVREYSKIQSARLLTQRFGPVLLLLLLHLTYASIHLYNSKQDLKEIIAEGTKKLASFGGGGGGGGGAAAAGGGGDAGAAAAAPKVEEKEEEEEVDMGGGMDM